MEGGNLVLQIINMGLQWGANHLGKPKPLRLSTIMPETHGAVQPSESKTLASPETPVSQVSNKEVVDYQRQELLKNALLLKTHLAQGCRINGKPCDCCTKHPTIIEGLAEEAIPMSRSSVYPDMARFARKIAPITTPEAVGSGQYDSQYPDLAIELRDLIKRLASEGQPA